MTSIPTFATVMNYQGSSFGVQVSDDELHRMASGDVGLIDEILKRSTTRLVLMPDDQGTSDNACQIQDFNFTETTSTNTSAPSTESSKGSSRETWTRNSTRILLSIVADNYTDLKNPRTKKKEFWDRMAMDIQEKGLAFSGSELHKKWNNILDSYRKNKEKESRRGIESIRWEWFETLEKFVDDEPKISPQNTTYRSSLPNEDLPSSDDQSSNYSGCDLPRSKRRKMRSDVRAGKCVKTTDSPVKASNTGNSEKPVRNALALEMRKTRELKQQMFEEIMKIEREKLKEERERWKEECERRKEERALRLVADQKKVDAVLLTAKAIQQLATAILKR